MRRVELIQPLTSEEQRQLRALLYRLSLSEMLKGCDGGEWETAGELSTGETNR